MAYDVYFDSIFNSFAYVPLAKADRVIVGGTVRDKSGKPVAGQLVTVVNSKGSITKLLTDAKGHYKLYGAPATRLSLNAGGTSKSVRTANSASTVDLEQVDTKIKVESTAVGTLR